MRRKALGTTLAVLAVSAIAVCRRGRGRGGDYTTTREFRALTGGWLL